MADAKLLRDTLVGRYQVAEDQVSLLTDEGLMRLKQGTAEQLGRIGPGGKLLMFFAGHACEDENGQPLYNSRLGGHRGADNGQAKPMPTYATKSGAGLITAPLGVRMFAVSVPQQSPLS